MSECPECAKWKEAARVLEQNHHDACRVNDQIRHDIRKANEQVKALRMALILADTRLAAKNWALDGELRAGIHAALSATTPP